MEAIPESDGQIHVIAVQEVDIVSNAQPVITYVVHSSQAASHPCTTVHHHPHPGPSQRTTKSSKSSTTRAPTPTPRNRQLHRNQAHQHHGAQEHHHVEHEALFGQARPLSMAQLKRLDLRTPIAVAAPAAFGDQVKAMLLGQLTIQLVDFIWRSRSSMRARFASLSSRVGSSSLALCQSAPRTAS